MVQKYLAELTFDNNYKIKAAFISFTLISVAIAISIMWPRSSLLDSEQTFLSYKLMLPNPASTIEKIKAAENRQSITVATGDNLFLIFKKYQVSDKTLQEILGLGSAIKPLTQLKPKQQLRLLLNDDGQLKKLEIQLSTRKKLLVKQTVTGFEAEKITIELESRPSFASGTIHNSLFSDARNAGLSENLVFKLAKIFAWDIDFSKDLRAGDSFNVVYEDYYNNGEKVESGEILAAEFVLSGKRFSAIRYTDASGHTDYYTPEGHNLRKAFLRTPVKFSRISSHFNPRRRHPILHTIRAHKGIDYAASRGTPIKSTASGKVNFVGTNAGYGKSIRINHGTKYTTIYAHMSRFAKNIKKGAHVKQGQTIGYVGMTGLATAPHLHYEFRIFGKAHNPLTVKLPKSNPIASQYRKAFNRHAKKVLAKLELYQQAFAQTNGNRLAS